MVSDRSNVAAQRDVSALFQRHSPTSHDPKNPKVLNAIDLAGINRQ
jgi:hypothetical protein